MEFTYFDIGSLVAYISFIYVWTVFFYDWAKGLRRDKGLPEKSYIPTMQWYFSRSFSEIFSSTIGILGISVGVAIFSYFLWPATVAILIYTWKPHILKHFK